MEKIWLKQGILDKENSFSRSIFHADHEFTVSL